MPYHDHHGFARDAALRLIGLASLVLSAFAVACLCRLAQGHGPHEATPIEMAFAAAGFFGASGGALLLALGRHVFDPVTISARWAPIQPGSARWPSEETQRYCMETVRRKTVTE